MWTRARWVRPPPSCCRRPVPASPARPFTSIAATTSWASESAVAMTGRLTIAIDGPAGSGKSSVARVVAERLGYLYLDSGAMYRALALKALRTNGGSIVSAEQLENLARDTHIELRPVPSTLHDPTIHNRVLLDGEDVTQSIRSSEVAQAASRVATIAGVRAVLVAEQQRAGATGGVVMEG